MNNIPDRVEVNEEDRPFETPQRESSIGVLLNFFQILVKQVRNGISFFIIFFFAIRKMFDSVFYTISIGILLTFILIVIISVFAYLQYKKLLFHIDYKQQEFHIEKGVMQKTTLVFRLDRIQQINLKRNWLQRILGLSSLEIETAGSTEKEVSLKALSTQTANELMRALMHFQVEKSETVESSGTADKGVDEDKFAAPEQIITTVSLGNLIKYGMSTHILRGLLLIFLPINYLYQTYSSLFFDKYNDVENYTKSMTASGLILLLFFLLLFSLLLNIILSIFKFYGFTLLKKDEELKLNFGLVNLKSISLRPLRIQLLKINQNYIQKYWSIVNYQIFQFNSLEQKDLSILLPGLTNSNQEIVNEYIHFPAFSEPIKILKPFKRMFYIRSLIHLVLLSLPVFIFSFNEKSLPLIPVLIIAALVFILIVFWNYKLFQNYQLEVYKDYLIRKSGFWNKKTLILNINKIQTISTKQYFWQKRLNIGEMSIVTAGGTFDFKFASFIALQEIKNKSLYQIEAFPKKWM